MSSPRRRKSKAERRYRWGYVRASDGTVLHGKFAENIDQKTIDLLAETMRLAAEAHKRGELGGESEQKGSQA